MELKSQTNNMSVLRATIMKLNLKALFPSKGKRLVWFVFFASLVTFAFFVSTDNAHAISFVDDPGGAVLEILAKVILWVSQLIIKLTIFCLQFFILVAGYNNYINAPVVILGWNMVRDVANMFFIVALLVIAFGTILGIESYEWRKTLPKLLLAALLVNFSNMICQLVIDIAQVFTTTFLNAVAGIAGGNLIQMMNFQEIYELSSGHSADNGASADFAGETFLAALMAMGFAFLAFFTIGAYMLVIVMRMVMLWVLMILSPLGFVFAALPATKSYADEFWKEFTSHVLVAPVMVFFLWLAFATFGGGDVVNTSIEGEKNNSLGSRISDRESTNGVKVAASLSEASSYDNMANFIVAIAFLVAGLDRVNKMGVKGGSATQSALKFARDSFAVATGMRMAQSAGRSIGGYGKDLGKDYFKLGKGKFHDMTGNRFKLGTGKLKRKAAISKLEEKDKNWAETVSTRGGGIAGALGPSKKVRYQAEKKLAMAKDDSAKDWEGYKLGQLTEQRNKYDERVKKLREEEVANRTNALMTANPSLTQADAQAQAAASLEKDKKKQVEMSLKAMKGLTEFEQMEGAGRAAQKSGKLGSETERLGAIVSDVLRVEENKDAKKQLDWESGQYKEEMEEWNQKSYDQIFAIMSENYDTIKRLNAKAASGAKLSKAESTDLKNAMQNQERAKASAMERGWGTHMAAMVAKKDASFRGMDLNDPESIHKVMLALSSGKTHTELDDAAGASQAQEQIRKGLKEKADVLMRIVMNAANKAADEHGQTQFGLLLSEGITSKGERKIGYTGTMRDGGGSGDQLGTGGSYSGRKAMADYQKEQLHPTFDLSSSTDGRAFVNYRANAAGDREVSGFVGAAQRKAFMEIANMSADQISKIKSPVINFVSGGGYDESSYDGTNFNAGAMANELREVDRLFKNRLARAVSSGNLQEQTKVRNSMREYYKKLMGTRGNDINNMTDAQVEALVSRIV